jgi:hypothetical protein
MPLFSHLSTASEEAALAGGLNKKVVVTEDSDSGIGTCETEITRSPGGRTFVISSQGL